MTIGSVFCMEEMAGSEVSEEVVNKRRRPSKRRLIGMSGYRNRIFIKRTR